MTDLYDRAQALEQRQRDEALARHAAGRSVCASLHHCQDCGDDIPEARRRAAPGCTRCITCQTAAER
ncbi:TraR/DksA family transcriptional regulator [Crenobacter sp. SG2305]|uniref:TraR/DksA family transcriptional regulator n=1 Tax=Crenobacter oryzisoli TaxID=3056844 RepID=UPI0025AAB61C|nr:TraR/DksA family transcriptional regulator [Crenobacter sp. SG2305]MDN0081608.1 TraR/DksA family transcriptional regulator [Crenobacter sp. SG2305]